MAKGQRKTSLAKTLLISLFLFGFVPCLYAGCASTTRIIVFLSSSGKKISFPFSQMRGVSIRCSRTSGNRIGGLTMRGTSAIALTSAFAARTVSCEACRLISTDIPVPCIASRKATGVGFQCAPSLRTPMNTVASSNVSALAGSAVALFWNGFNPYRTSIFCPWKDFSASANLCLARSSSKFCLGPCLSAVFLTESIYNLRANSALAARSCCFPSSVLASVRALSNWRNCADWRWLMIFPVTRTPTPAANVINRRITANQIEYRF